jgi:tetratricopeptide (TPR) repeat protein
VSISLSGYLRLYKESWVQLQKSSPGLSSYEDRTLYSTWQISFNHVKQQNNLSAKLLCFWAYFDNQDLWLELLQHSDSNDPEWVRALAEDEVSFHSTMRVLCNHGLVEEDMSSQELIESRGYSMHSCVHSWTIQVLNQTWDYDLARLAVTFVGSHVLGEQTIRPLLTQRRLLQHATRCSSMVLNGLVPEDGIASLCHNLGVLYADQGELVAAEQIYQCALRGKEKVLGAGDISTLQTVCNVGNLYRVQGKLDKAETMYRRALHGFEEALGAEHTSTLDVVNHLAVLYVEQSRLGEAETMYLRVLQGFKEALRPEHPSTLETLNNLGILYAAQSKFDEAELMYLRALQGKEKAVELGPEHKSTLQTVNNLGILYARRGDLAKAEQVLGRALQGKEKVLGPEDLSTLNTVNNLGNVYAKQSKFDKAERMYLRAMQGYEKAGWGNSIPALNTFSGLGSLFKRQGHLAKARMMYSKALAGYEKVVGPDHPISQKLRRKLRALKSKL